MVQKALPIRKLLVAGPVALLLIGLLGPLSAETLGASPALALLDKAPEPATFAVIGGALCLLSLRLRRRKN